MSNRRDNAPTTSLPLSSLLSHVLVAFTIEFDNEAEHQLPHRTTNYGSTASSLHSPWLVSLAMWANCMQFVGEEGVSVRELERLARAQTNLNGMERWGYIVIEPDPADRRPKPPRSGWIIRATAGGRMAQEIWRPLFSIIEKRWQKRFGKEEIGQLRESLRTVVGLIDLELPDCLPVLGYGLFSKGRNYERKAGQDRKDEDEENQNDSGLPLSALLARVLLAFAIEFESESDVSLAICANVLRVLDEKGIPLRNLPRLSGVSKPAITVAMGILQKKRMAVIESDPSRSSGKVALLTSKGREAQTSYRKLLDIIEERWRQRFGEETIRDLRQSLQRFVGEPTAERSALFQGLEPYPDGWRASVPRPTTLPHYPMVLHRGGFPDGS